MRRLKIAKAYDNIRASMWLIPSALVFASVILSTILLVVDATVARGLTRDLRWLFSGTADGARTILSVIAGSLITVIAVAFSITILAIQQAATHYSPRLLRNFTRDRGNQVVLGTYIATFTYALLVLRQIRDETESYRGFIPTISISVVLFLALVSVGLLIYFIHHTAESLQVSYLFSTIRRELDPELAARLPSAKGESGAEALELSALLKRCLVGEDGPASIIRSTEEGYLRVIDEDGLFSALPAGTRVIHVAPQVGHYVLRGDPVVEIWPEAPSLTLGEVEILQRSFALDRNRSIAQDPLFGIRQIVDVALKALSPGINDPTTAEQSLDHLGAALAYVVDHELPSPLRTTPNGALALFNRPTFADYVEESFSQLRQAAKTHVHVLLHCLGVIGRIAERVPNADRVGPLRVQVYQIRAALATSDFTEADRALVRDAAEQVLAALARRVT